VDDQNDEAMRFAPPSSLRGGGGVGDGGYASGPPVRLWWRWCWRRRRLAEVTEAVEAVAALVVFRILQWEKYQKDLKKYLRNTRIGKSNKLEGICKCSRLL